MRMHARLGPVALALSCALSIAPAVSSAETLADALVSAYRNSNLLDQNRALLRAADEDVATQVSALRPTLDFIVGYQYQEPESAFRRAQDAARLSQTYALQ